MSELFETSKKKRGRPKKQKSSKLEKNKKQLKEMIEDIVENSEERKGYKRDLGVQSFSFKCSECGISVTLYGDHPSFPKRKKCARCEDSK